MDRHGDELAVTRQLDACRQYAAERGWVVRAEYVDNDISATSGKARPRFEDLLQARPSAVVVWHIDRLVRVTRDLERVIDLGADVYAVKAGHLDLSNPAGRAVARTVTAWATYETEQKAVRQKAANDQRAEAGLPYRCQRAFGFEADGLTIRETEAAELRAAADAVVRGATLKSIADDWNGRGIWTAKGGPWRQTTVKQALLSPRNHGLRRHRGEVVGPGVWPAIIDEVTGATVKAILTDPARARSGPPRRYLLSGVMRCGKCGLPVVGAVTKDKGPLYRCPTLHLTRQAPKVDEFITTLVVGRLAQPDALDLFTSGGDGRSRLAEISQKIIDGRARLDGLAEAYAVGAIDAQSLRAGSKRIQEQMEALDAELVAEVVDPALATLSRAADVPGVFAGLPLESRRRVIGTLMSITLEAVGSGRRTFDPRSVCVEWKD